MSTHSTLADVAREAGVGNGTVSRVINGGKLVSPLTRAQVLAAMEKLRYQPNHAARVLKGERTRTIGLVVPDIADSFFAKCAGAVHKIAHAYQSAVLLMATNNDPQTEMEDIKIFSRRTDGLLLVPTRSNGKELVELLQSLTIPVVTFDRPVEGIGVTSVLLRNQKGARIATQHLIEHGYRRILCLAGERQLYTIRERIQGYSRAMRKAGLSPLVHSSIARLDYEATEQILESYVGSKSRIEAIFTAKNSTTIYAFEALKKLGVKIPGGVALVGFDDFELAASLDPPVTVIAQPIQDAGRIAAEHLFRQVSAYARRRQQLAPFKPKIIELEPSLIVRGSCGCNPASR